MAFSEDVLYKIAGQPFLWRAVRNEERAQWEFVIDIASTRFVVKDSAPLVLTLRDKPTPTAITVITPY